MASRVADQIDIQRSYYARTAGEYDHRHIDGREHKLALTFMIAAARDMEAASALDIGSGTGRAVLAFRRELPGVRAVGVEPVEELRRLGHAKGVPEDCLIAGDATALEFADRSFDIVCAFGALHHIPKPAAAIAEMLRVARKAIFVSDANNFGQGGAIARRVKQAINAVGLWPLADYIKTRGKGYTLSDGDGLAYSYSVFNDLPKIGQACRSVHLMNTSGGDGEGNLYRTASHIAILGLL